MITKYLYIGGYNGFFIETIQEAFSRFGWENHIAEDSYLEYSFPKTDVPFWEKVIEYIIP